MKKRLALFLTLTLLLVLAITPSFADDGDVGIQTVDSVSIPSSFYAGTTIQATVDITSAGYDCGVGQQCFQLRILADWYTGTAANYTLSSTFEYFSDVTASDGGLAGSYRVLLFTTDAVVPATEFDEFTFTIPVSAGANAGSDKRVFVREQTGLTSFSTRASNFATVLAVPTIVYADPAGVCGGNTPCFTTVGAAVTAVASGGTLNLYGTFTDNPTIDKDLTLQSSSNGTINGTITVTAGNVTIRGLTLSGAPAIDNTGGTVTAYANNIDGSVSGSGSYSHNWWGSYTAQPTGVSGADWDKRLGAAVEGYGIGSLGLASVTGGTGTAVVVSHGRGSFNAPFGHATVADGNTQCSDYYDFFVQSGSGTWTVNVPIDNGSGCDSVYNSRTLFLFNLAPALGCMDGPGGGDPNPACWDSLLASGEVITQIPSGSNRLLRWSGVATSDLQGTPIVSGNQDDLDPTAVTLQNFGLEAGVTVWPFALGLMLLAGFTFVVVRRRWA